ncbi:MAG: NADH-quinone oxidoreductase subunit A [Opitutales bacterium]|nr:NADH-quinone oxidoreductase subunit A [Opitutales bacterium]
MQEVEFSYLPVLVQVIIGCALPVIIIILSHITGQRGHGNRNQDVAYECGLKVPGNPHPRFNLRFYVTALLFVLFDIEVVFLIPAAIVYRSFLKLEGLQTLCHGVIWGLGVFIFILLFGLWYEVKKGALNWEKRF